MPMSSSVARAIQVMNDSKSSASDLAEVLTFDMALAAKLLRVANSAYYSFERKVATVSEAIVRLGFSTIRRLILTSHVSGFMNRRIDSYGLEQGELWKHSIGVGMGVMMLAQKDKSISIGEAYIAGLLHDIGKAFLDQYLGNDLKPLVDRGIQEQVDIHTAERDMLGTDHAEVGALIAQKWNLPIQIVEGIAFHHRPMLAKQAPRLTSVIHVVDVFCYSGGLTSLVDGLQIPAVQIEAVKMLNLRQADMDNLKEHLDSSMQFADAFFEEPGENKVAGVR